DLGQRIAASLRDAHRPRGPAYTLAYHLKGGGENMRKGILFAAAGLLVSLNANAQLTMHGAVQFPDEHVFTRALVRFQELTDKYSGKKTNWVLHKNSELGL